MIQDGSNATRVMKPWGTTLAQAQAIAAQPESMTIYDKDGKVLYSPPLPSEIGGSPILFSNRGELQIMMHEYAVSLGITFQFGTRILEYFETDKSAGAVIDGERREYDGVIAADGVHSKARKYVSNIEQLPRTSGFAVYRCRFDRKLLAKSPLTKKYAESTEDSFQVWLGTDVHAILFIIAAAETAVIFCTHKVSNRLENTQKKNFNIPRIRTKWRSPGVLLEM
jgi:2-polyprenyl-6-methoxyphenol hydroxylase-like FAD-dependent oxidoreductase